MAAEETYRYVVVGAGSAGCVVAARLSEDPDATVLLLEAGGLDDRPEIHARDLASLFALWQSDWAAEIDWGYVTEPEPHLDGRRVPVARGRVLGGSSSVNALMYVRGNRRDYDAWSYLGNVGWSYEHVLPYFKRSEDYEGGASAFRGTGGPLSVVDHHGATPVAEAFVTAAQQLGFGGPEHDYNGARQEGSAFFYQATRTRDGRRCSAADAFLAPARHRPNLAVRTGARASRVVLRNGRATGVEYLAGGDVHRVRADAEVIVCAGAFESPKLLMLSGVGPPAELRAHGVPVVADVPGVGGNLQDHPFVPICYQCRREHPPATLVSESGLFTHSGDAEEAASPDLQFTFGTAKFLAPDAPESARVGPGFTFAPVAVRPQSVGRVTLRSGDPLDLAVVRCNYLEADADVRVLVRGIELARVLAHQPAFEGLRAEELTPGPGLRSAAELERFVRANATTLWHPVGTCRMGGDHDAVVDARLRVHGVEGLRVADASVMPAIVAGNTNAACIMIGEKAAAMIAGSAAETVPSGAISLHTGR